MADNCSTSPTNYPSDCEILEGYRTKARERDSEKDDPYRLRALARAKEIKLLLLDVDGVLTDGNLLYSDSGEESKSFNTQDGFGLRLLGEAGIHGRGHHGTKIRGGCQTCRRTEDALYLPGSCQ